MSQGGAGGLARAKNLIALGAPESLRYACLELRYCIERAAYEKVRLFEKRIPQEIIDTWQPNQVLEALLEYEPEADKDYEVRIAPEYSDGSRGPFATLGKHQAIRLRFIKTHYNKLGYHLHIPTPSQSASRPQKETDLLKYLQSLIPEVERFVSSKVAVGVANTVSFVCHLCKHTNVRRDEALEANPVVTCRGQGCKAQYRATRVSEGVQFDLETATFECPDCKAHRAFGLHELSEGTSFACAGCSKSFVIARQWVAGPEEV